MVPAPGTGGVDSPAAAQDRFHMQKVSRQILRGLLGPCHVVPGGNDFGSTYSLRKFLHFHSHPKIDQTKQ
jgi:hypothetical protein